MRWIVLLTLLVCCVDNSEEDMKLFISSLSSESLEPTFPVLPIGGVRALGSTGQSNQSGAMPLDDLSAQELLPYPDVKIFPYTSTAWADLQIGVNNKYKVETAPLYGYELGLGKQWGESSSSPLYLMKHGLGGTNIDWHLPPYANVGDTDGLIWYNLRGRILTNGINELLSQGKRVFFYMYWCQGENDSFAGRVDGYEALFDEWVLTWQNDLGTDLPFIICTIVENDANDVTINNVFRAKAATMPDKMKIIETADLGVQADNLHYDKEGYETIATRCIEYMKVLTPIEIISPLTPPPTPN